MEAIKGCMEKGRKEGIRNDERMKGRKDERMTGRKDDRMTGRTDERTIFSPVWVLLYSEDV